MNFIKINHKRVVLILSAVSMIGIWATVWMSHQPAAYLRPGESPPPASGAYIRVDISEQQLFLYQDGQIVKNYPVSTSKYGIGNAAGSFKTPLGRHFISKKIGEGVPLGTIFKNRENTQSIAEPQSFELKEDLITSRILWLEGLERGLNKGKNVDTFDRFIYIHGTTDEASIGKPASIGCVRMKNADVVELFDTVNIGTLVDLHQ